MEKTNWNRLPTKIKLLFALRDIYECQDLNLWLRLKPHLVRVNALLIQGDPPEKITEYLDSRGAVRVLSAHEYYLSWSHTMREWARDFGLIADNVTGTETQTAWTERWLGRFCEARPATVNATGEKIYVFKFERGEIRFKDRQMADNLLSHYDSKEE